MESPSGTPALIARSGCPLQRRARRDSCDIATVNGPSPSLRGSSGVLGNSAGVRQGARCSAVLESRPAGSVHEVTARGNSLNDRITETPDGRAATASATEAEFANVASVVTQLPWRPSPFALRLHPRCPGHSGRCHCPSCAPCSVISLSIIRRWTKRVSARSKRTTVRLLITALSCQ